MAEMNMTSLADVSFTLMIIFLIAGVFLGGGAAFYNMYRKLTAAQKADDERRKLERERKK